MGSFSASLKAIGDTRGIPATVELREGRLSIKAGDSEIGDWHLEDVDLEPTPTGYRLAAEGDQVLLDMSDSEQFAQELSSLSKNGTGRMLGLFARRDKKSERDVADIAVPVEPKRTPSARETVSRLPASLMGSATSNETRRASEPVAQVTQVTEETNRPGKATPSTSRLVAMLDSAIEASEKRWGSLLPPWVFNRGVFVAGLALVTLAFVFRGLTSVALLVLGVVVLMFGGVTYTDDVMASKLLPGRTTPTHVLIAGVSLLGVGIAFGLIA